ncbi:E3 ubiquitin-protein ligase Topors-like isoform X1 [Phyllopteryx taeniolatus]|uniref:E3 ubiquitin-protein ligase Topors-like isoform X1 n=1 Tax=Phyllopteryx taeniolatus TaxID=161469 RepID=UPI002AD511F1|nr:E3 ubiquitin-protein ligase Topors-like isoform X1 [Phyllopteryx taeniolatus]XP_061620518.1 E3 ubiquitin-protein ligase Topors-like isoform X1 [Phyllopteryx taeniolatus]
MAPTAMKLRDRRRYNNNNNSGEAQPEEVPRSRASRRGKKTGTDTQAAAASSPPAPSARAADEASPDSKCPICLDRFNNMAYLDHCLHRFCFPCIQEWSHNKAECPLCKQPFASILHSVRAEDEFKEYTLRPTPTSSSVAATVAMVAAMASASEEEHGVWEWYLDVLPFPLSERGVIFEGPTGHGDTGPGRPSRRLVTRLATRLRLQREGVAAQRLTAEEMVAFRRALYRGGIRVRGVAGAAEPERDVTVDSFRRDPTQLNRLRPWLRRELTVLYGAYGSLVDVVQRIIAARVARHGLEDAATMQEELQPFLLAQTAHFLHELLCFARSPLSLDEYDVHAAYHPPPANNSGSPSISEEAEVGRRHNDETPGPSNSAALTLAPSSPVRLEDEAECLIVGYKKPLAERTPELVHLSSDSDSSSPAIPPSAARHEKAPAAGSVSSVCTLSPPLPDKKMKKKKRRRSRECMRKSGTLANPNRSIYPAMMCSLSHSSLESGSPLALSSSDCSWEFSSSSPSSSVCSSSPPPSPLSPLRSSGEKPSGKRKYKSRHLDEHSQPDRRRRRRGRSKRRSDSRKIPAGPDSTGGHQRDRSPSVEIVYEGAAPPKRHRKTQEHGGPPLIITLESDSSDDGDPSRPRALSSVCSTDAVVDLVDAPSGPCEAADVKDFTNRTQAAVCQVRSGPPPLLRAPTLKLQDAGTKEEEEEDANFSPPSSSLHFLSHTTDLFRSDTAAGSDLSPPLSPTIMSCHL